MAHREGVPRTRPGNLRTACLRMNAVGWPSCPSGLGRLGKSWGQASLQKGASPRVVECCRVAQRRGRKVHCLRLPAPQRRARLRSAKGRRYRMMPDDQRQGSKVYCLSLRPCERLCRGGPHCPRQEHRAAPLCRRVLQLIRAAPRAEGTLSAPASPGETGSAAAYPRSAKGRRYSVCACQPRTDAECCSLPVQRQGSKVQA